VVVERRVQVAVLGVGQGEHRGEGGPVLLPQRRQAPVAAGLVEGGVEVQIGFGEGLGVALVGGPLHAVQRRLQHGAVAGAARDAEAHRLGLDELAQ
jgi:hypothetical protein